MKFFALASLLFSLTAFAGEVVVMDVSAKGSTKFDTVSARFLIDQTAGTGAAELSVTREHEICHHDRETGRDCTTWTSVILNEKAPIEGLTVVDKKVSIGNVDCGTMGVSRVFKVPTFYMSGNCTLSADRVTVAGEKRIIVKLITKE